MSKNKYLIPEPTTEINSEYLGTLLITQNANQYACKKKTDKDNWWAIGMIASNGSYWTPVIVSNKREYCRSYSDAFFSESPLSGLMGYFHYKGNTYYSSFSAYGSNLISSDLPNASVPVCSESFAFDGAIEAGEKLIELYVASGGLMPGEGYPTSWVCKLEENVLQKTFTYAHAKTVYTDYANKKTLSDKLLEIDTEIGNKANKTEIPTELPANGGNSTTVNGHTVKSNVPENAVFTDTKDWESITGKPDSFLPSSHGHTISEITGLQDTLDGKASASHTHTKSQITDFPTSMPANGGNADTVNSHTVKSDVPENAVFTDTVYDDTEVKEEIVNINSNLTSEISRAKKVEEILKSRVDTITSLPEGSTTGDAELQDIRVKADGTTAKSAGNAVREQISELKSDFGNLRFSITENNLLHVERKE